MSADSTDLFENLLKEFRGGGYEFISDYIQDERRVVQLKKHTLHIVLVKTNIISYDVYADLNTGIYEIGDLHSLTTKMLNVKKICLSYKAREMNTTERLYPDDRRGPNTTTSGL